MHSVQAYDEAAEDKRIYLIARYHRLSCFCIFGFFGCSMAMLAFQFIAAVEVADPQISKILELLFLLLALPLFPLAIGGLWCWIRLRTVLYGNPLRCALMGILCLGMPPLFIFEIMLASHKIKDAYQSQNIVLGLLGLPDKETLLNLKNRAELWK